MCKARYWIISMMAHVAHAQRCEETTSARGIVRPGLVVMRSGERRLFARQLDTNRIVAFSAKAGSDSWEVPTSIGLTGPTPTAVELADGMLLVGSLGTDRAIKMACTWPSFGDWLVASLAGGYAIPIGGQMQLALGMGLGLNGNLNNLEQLPLSAEQQERWLSDPREFIDDNDPVIIYDGPWKTETESGAAGGSLHLGGRKATMTVPFHGTGVGLVFNTGGNYGLIQVFIDGREYPPVDRQARSLSRIAVAWLPDCRPGRTSCTRGC